MLIALTAAAALVPSLLLIWYLRSRDRNPEPGRVVWTTFFLGIAIIPPILAVAFPADNLAHHAQHPLAVGFLSAFLGAAIPEELFKYLVVTRYAARHRAFDEPMDGIVYGAVASLGFATMENVLYVMEGGMGVAVLRALTAVPGHAATGVIMGYYVGRARFSTDEAERTRLLRTALGFAILLHGLYDFPLLALKQYEASGLERLPFVTLALVLLTFGVLAYEARLARRLVREARVRQDRDALFNPQPALAAGGLAPTAAPDPTSGPPHPTVAATAASVGRAAGAIVILLLGGALITVGGLILIGFIINLSAKGSLEGSDFAVLGLFGLAPVALGLRLFRAGLRRLHG